MESSQITGEAFHISYERPQSVLEVVDNITKLMNSDLVPIIQNQSNLEPKLECGKSQELVGLETGV